MEMVTTGAAFVAAKGGCGATSAAVLTAFGLSGALSGTQRPVLVDCCGDMALALDIGEEIDGIAEVAIGACEIDEALWELVEDPAEAAAMPAFMGRGRRNCSPEGIAAVTALLIEDGQVPVLDCGAGRDAMPLLEALETDLLLSRVVMVVPSPSAATAAVALGTGGPGARRVLLDSGSASVVSASEFAAVFAVDAIVEAIPQWHEWQMTRTVPEHLVRACAEGDVSPAGAAIAALTALLAQPMA